MKILNDIKHAVFKNPIQKSVEKGYDELLRKIINVSKVSPYNQAEIDKIIHDVLNNIDKAKIEPLINNASNGAKALYGTSLLNKEDIVPSKFWQKWEIISKNIKIDSMNKDTIPDKDKIVDALEKILKNTKAAVLNCANKCLEFEAKNKISPLQWDAFFAANDRFLKSLDQYTIILNKFKSVSSIIVGVLGAIWLMRNATPSKIKSNQSAV